MHFFSFLKNVDFIMKGNTFFFWEKTHIIITILTIIIGVIEDFSCEGGFVNSNL